MRKLVGDDSSAIKILRDEIPALVVNWAKTSDLNAAQKKAKLKEVFDDESARANELATAFDLFASRFEVRVAELVSKEVSSVVRKLDTSFEELESAKTAVLNMARSFSSAKFKFAGEEIGERADIGASDYPNPPGTNSFDVLQNDGLEKANAISDTERDSTSSRTNEQIFQDLSTDSSLDESVLQKANIAQEPVIESTNMIGSGLRFDEIEEMIDEILSLPNE